MDFMLGIAIGLVLGATAGALIMAALATGKRADRYTDHAGYDSDEDYPRRPRNGF